MQQPTPKGKTASKLKQHKFVRRHKEFGTSKLEKKFALEFLERLGIKYKYQFKAESIGRYYDFYIPSANVIIEVDGCYYHGYGKTHKEKNPMQKHNERVDKQKDLWAALNGYKLIRIWENDINDNPSKVLNLLKEEIGEGEKKQKINENKKKRH